MYNGDEKGGFIVERKFYRYASKSLPVEWANVFADAESNKDLYKFTNEEVLNMVELCGCPGTIQVNDIVSLINEYYKDYEMEVFHDDLGKQLIVPNVHDLVGTNRVKDVRIVTKTEVYSIAKKLNRASWRFIVLGAYEGIGSYGAYPKQDLLEARADQIDVVKRTITLPSGYTFEYSSELIEAAVESSKEDSFEDANGRVFRNADTGRILRVVDSVKGNGILSYPSLQRYYYAIKDLTGNPCIGWQRLAMSGFYNSMNDRLKGKQYKEEDRDMIMDLLERYNKKTVKTESIKNLRYYRKVVK